MNTVSLVGMINIIVIAAMATTVAAAAAVLDSQIALPGCPDHCGEVKVPYPFGTHQDCFLSEKFFIDCDDQSFKPPKPFLGERENNLTVSNITLNGSELVIMFDIGIDCYNKDGTQGDYFSPWLRLGDFNIATDRNKFTAVGCDTYATVSGYRGEQEYITGCVSYCNEIDNFHLDSCSGVGCCQTSIPSGFTNITVSVNSYNNHTFVYDFNPCSYAFVTEESMFKFSRASFQELKSIDMVPMVLNWAIGSDSCNEAEKNRNDYACKGNSKCVNASNGSGYLCQCLEGYQGNPYHPEGCQDIDECKSTNSNPCGKNSICHNSPGTFTCICEKGFNNIDTNRCSKVSRQRSLLFVYGALGVSIALVVAISLICWGMKKRKVNNMKKKFFEQNGGLTLQQQLYSSSSRRQSHETTQIFSAEELKKATNNYHESRVLGQGGYGIVYKGILPTNRVVAIKKSKFGVQKVNEQFINEVVMLLQINHRNVVKLFGCCLETEVPLLVYEFVSNGTVFEHIHNKSQGYSPLSWELRLKIATDTAGALAYLHSATSTPIIHRDVKTGNILLDEKFTAKVSDFGASRLIPLDQTQLSTVVQGTFGYLDPEYMHTSQLTEKSDVYSFGVVLAELLTGEKVLSFDRPENQRSLAMFFVSFMKDDRLLEIIDDDIMIEGNVEELKYVANLAKRCLRIKSQERPNMKEVAAELEGVLRSSMEMQEWGKAAGYTEETEHLLTSEPSDLYAFDVSGPMCSQ